MAYTLSWHQGGEKEVGAYIHLDENTPYVHIDYIPIAQCSRGMKIQNSLTKALENQGFIFQSAKKHCTNTIETI